MRGFAKLCAALAICAVSSTGALAASIFTPVGATTCSTSTNCTLTGSGVSGASYTTTVDIPANSVIMTAEALRSGIALTSTDCSDNVGGTRVYSPVSSTYGSGGSPNTRLFYYLTAVDTPIGTVITCTFSSSTAAKEMAVVAISGLSSSPLDAAAALTGTSVTSGNAVNVPSSSPPTPSTTSDIVVALVGENSTAVTLPSGYTSITSSPSYLSFSYTTLSSNAGLTYSPTSNYTGTYTGQIALLKQSGATVTVKACTLSLMGVGAC